MGEQNLLDGLKLLKGSELLISVLVLTTLAWLLTCYIYVLVFVPIKLAFIVTTCC